MQKTITFIDEDRNSLVEYKCRLTTDAEAFGCDKFLFGLCTMDFDKTIDETHALKPKNYSSYITAEFYKLLADENDVIDLRGVISLFNKKIFNETDFVQNLIRNFLNLFEFEKKAEYSISDAHIMEVFIRHPSFVGTEEASHIKKVLNSISGNTKILKHNSKDKYIIPKNDDNKEVTKKKER